MDKEKARAIYTRKKSLPNPKKLSEVEEVFFEDNNFVPGVKLALLDQGRFFYISKDGRFYFSPDWFSKNVFVIYDCNKIKDVSLVETGQTNSALDGALLLGTAGAIAGASSKSSNYAIKVMMDDPARPVMFSLLTIGLVKGGTPLHQNMLVLSEKIISHLKKYIKEAPAKNDFMNELRELANLKQAGLLTDEEFAAAKAKLLS